MLKKTPLLLSTNENKLTLSDISDINSNINTDINTDKYYYDQDLKGALGIVIGNEGSGISSKVKNNCDFLVKIPMKGKVTSLNASVSTGIIIYEALKQRM